MAHELSETVQFIALNLQGDIGPITCYTSQRGKVVTFPRVPPLNPPSPTQEVIRERFRQSAVLWNALTPQQRAAWLTLADRCNLGITGYDLWTHYAICQDFCSLDPLERFAGITLTRPAKV